MLGEFAYGCLKDKEDDNDLASTDVLPNPYHERVTLVRDFIKIPNLENTLTDSHFAKRDRMGRTLVFLSRLVQDGWSKAPREVAIDEKSAVLVEPDGKGTVVGSGKGRLLPAGHGGARGLQTQCSAYHPQHFRLPGSRRRAF